MVFHPCPVRIPPDPDERVAWLRRLIALQTEESSSTEYKSGKALNADNLRRRDIKVEMGKDASSMANGIGGVIIFGIKEKLIIREGWRSRGQAIDFCSVINPNVSRDVLTEILRDNIRPPLPGLSIVEVISNDGQQPEFRCFVVEIPSSCTAHQSKDNKFFVRRTATTDEMEQPEIVTVMNREAWPQLEVKVLGSCWLRTISLQVEVLNTGRKMCSHLWVQLVFPLLVSHEPFEARNRQTPYCGTDRGKGLRDMFYSGGQEPLPPGMSRTFANFWTCSTQYPGQQFTMLVENPLRDEVLIRVFADDRPMMDYWVNVTKLETSLSPLEIEPAASTVSS